MDTSVDATSLLILALLVSSPNSCAHKLTWEGSNPLLQMPQCHAYVISIATIAFMHQTSRYCCILFKDFMNNYYNDSSAYTCYEHMLQLETFFPSSASSCKMIEEVILVALSLSCQVLVKCLLLQP